MKNIDLNNKKWQWILLIFLSFIWGSSFILMKQGLKSYSNMQVAAFRMFFSFLFFIPVIIKKIKLISRQNIKSLLIVGFIGNAFPAVLFTTAQVHISSSLAGILNSLVPIFTLSVGYIVYKQRNIKLLNVIGIGIGFLGVAGLVMGNPFDSLGSLNLYALLIVLATLFYGINVNEVKYNLKKMSGLDITALAFFLVGPWAGIYLAFSGFELAIQTPHYIKNLMFIVTLALFSSVIAVILLNILIKYTTPIFVSSVTYIIPIFAIFWGLLDGETLSILQWLCMLVIIAGIYLGNKK